MNENPVEIILSFLDEIQPLLEIIKKDPQQLVSIYYYVGNKYTYNVISSSLDALVKKGDTVESSDNERYYTFSELKFGESLLLKNINISVCKNFKNQEEDSRAFVLDNITITLKKITRENIDLLVSKYNLSKTTENVLSFKFNDLVYTINISEVLEHDVDIKNNSDTNNNNKEQNSEEIKNLQSLTQQVEMLKQELEKEKQKRLLLMSDFQNYQKRVEIEKATFGAITNMNLIEAILEVFDDINLALSDTNLNIEQSKISLESAKNKLKNAIEMHDIEILNIKVGDDFDSSKMEAVSVVSSEENNKNKVIAIISSGIKFKSKDNVIRPAKVVVGK